eukprot:gb/GECG01011479.1/.p1 GENE.gb/GECG01011479.1/~~gb/GECG01011479.1/.p1  ORF type:complete len:181 (+),score=21.32 gb/GECG01011479.1/:1-543(+)
MPKSNKAQQQLDPSKLRNKKFDEIISPYQEQDNAQGFLQGVVVLVAAFFTALLPAYIFAGPMFELSIEENFIVFSAVTVSVGFLLHTSTRQMAKEKLDKIAQSRGNVGATEEERRHQRKLQGKEATAYSIFVTNFVYLLIFSILSQQVLNSLLYSFPVYNYITSALLSVVPLVGYVKGYI